MDFSNRASKPMVPRPALQEDTNGEETRKISTRQNRKSPKFKVVLVVAVLVVLALLFGAYMMLGSNESSRINTSKYQAVFLNDGQVYFGHITHLDSQYIDLKNIYYVTSNSTSSTSSSSTPSNVQLVKLGCELHSPYDEMVLNMSQVTFWENIQDNGKIVTAINNFKQANPNGQNCSNQTQGSTQQAPITTPAKQ